MGTCKKIHNPKIPNQFGVWNLEFCFSPFPLWLGYDAMIDQMKKSGLFVFVIVLAMAGVAIGQDRSTGSIKGKVRVETGSPSGVAVIVRQGDREVARGTTDKKGEFVVSRLMPGRYGVTLRKPGLSVGTIEDVEVKAGKTRSLGDR